MISRGRSPNGEAYDVGYARPPKAGQFRKGESGNKSGRPKGSKNLSTLLREALAKEVVVTENEKRRRVTKRELMMEMVAAKCIAGDLRAVALAIRLDADEDCTDSEPTEGLDQADRDVAETLSKQLHNAPKEHNDE